MLIFLVVAGNRLRVPRWSERLRPLSQEWGEYAVLLDRVLCDKKIYLIRSSDMCRDGYKSQPVNGVKDSMLACAEDKQSMPLKQGHQADDTGLRIRHGQEFCLTVHAVTSGRPYQRHRPKNHPATPRLPTGRLRRYRLRHPPTIAA